MTTTSAYADPNSGVFKTRYEGDDIIASKHWVRRGLFQRFISIISFGSARNVPPVGYRWI